MFKNFTVRKLFLTGLLLLSNAFPTFAADGPLGLSWGLSVPQVNKLSSGLKALKTDGKFTIYTTTNLPKNLSFAESYNLTFHSNFGLQKIVIIGKTINSDPTGNEGKKTYSELKNSITERYGLPSNKYSMETIGNKLYKEYDEFYQCLKYQGCGAWSSLWDLNENGTIALEIKGLSRGSGYLILSYEGPKWSEAVDMHRNERSSVDKSAL